MRLAALLDVLEGLAPLGHAEPWDNVGLLAGDPDAEIATALVTVDATGPVVDEALARGADLVVAYHPPLFAPVKRLDARTPLVRLDRAGRAVYAVHTALDVAPGGTNDVLAAAAGVVHAAPLRFVETKDRDLKLVTFVPAEAADAVADALAAAGAGVIGDYTRCSFRLAGEGTFFGGEGAKPAVGAAGRLERVPEVRLEVLVPAGRARAAVAALRAAHPYEEPAFDLVRLAPEPAQAGIGRVGDTTLGTLGAVVASVKRALGLAHVLVAGELDAPARRVATCAGAGGDLLDAARAAGADVFLTGELRHHDALRARAHGMSVVACLHSNSERAAVHAFAARLAEATVDAGLVVTTSALDRDPFVVA